MSTKATAFKAGSINTISRAVAKEQAPAIFATKPADYINCKQTRYSEFLC